MSKKQEGIGLGITNEGEGIANPITAWAVEVNGEISPYSVVRTRAIARDIRNNSKGWGAKKASVRKVKIEVIKGAR